MMAVVLSLAIGSGTAAARDAGTAPGKGWLALPHLPQLTGAQLSAAAGIGLAAGVTAVIASRNALAGFGLGAVVALYVAHLAVEAALVGGAYYFWQADKNPRDQPAHRLKLRIAAGPNRI